MLKTPELKSTRLKRLSREGGWILLGQIFVVIGSLVGVRVVTELLKPSAYGELALGLTLATMVNQVVLGPISNGIGRFYAPATEQGELSGYLAAAYRIVLSATVVILGVILFAVIGLWSLEKSQWIAISFFSIVFAILSGYSYILNGIQNAARQRSAVALHRGMESWFRFLIAAGMIVWLGATSTVAMLGYAVSVTLVLISQFFVFKHTIQRTVIIKTTTVNWMEKIYSFSWPFSVFGVFTWLQISSDRWALKLFAGTQDVGLYAVLFQLGYYPVSLVTGMVVQLLAPILYQRAGDASDEKRIQDVTIINWRLAKLALTLSFVAFFVAYMMHMWIFQLFVAKEYSSVSFLLPWLILAGGLFASGEILGLDMACKMRTGKMAIPKVGTALLGICLNFLGAYLFGVAGIVVAAVLFSLSYLLWMAFLAKFECGQVVKDSGPEISMAI